ncbi:MAG: hypothetical protein GY940_07270 [bacterium]|nr:hypothetical protein [bacterium]
MKHKWLYIITITTLALIFLHFPGHGQERDIIQGDQLVIGKIVKLQSKLLNEERVLWIYLPDGYSRSKKKYPVFYLLDGDSQFHHVSGIVQFLSRLYFMPEMIIVAIPNTNRDRDFLSTVSKRWDWPPVTGSDQFQAFFKEELIPFMNKNYRCSPHRVLCGHSLGGLFCIEFFLNSPELFYGYISISPSLFWADRYLLEKAGKLLKDLDGNRSLYFTVSGADKQSIEPTRQLAKLLEEKAVKGLDWHFEYLEKENHGSVVHRTVYNALERFYSGMRLPRDKMLKMSLDEIKEYYEKLSKTYGFNIPVPESVTGELGYVLMEQKKFDRAIEVFKFQLNLKPDSFESRMGLGDTYYEQGKMEPAIMNYKILLQLAKKTKHVYMITFAKSLLGLAEKKMKEKTK